MSADTSYDEDDGDPSAGTGSRINVKKVALISAAIAGVALLGSAVVYGPTFVRVQQQRGTKVETPPQVGALSMDTSEDAKSTAEYIRDAIDTQVNLDTSVGAIYKDQAGESATRSVILVAGTGRIYKPEDSLGTAFKAVADESGGVRDVHDADPGPLGGVLRCGVTSTQDGDLPVCGWADYGSVAVALFPGRPVAEAEKTLRELRTAVEHR